MMRVMQDMELTEDESYDSPAPIPLDEKPKYPWGLRISLCQDELNKLGLDVADAMVGGIVHLHAFAEITSVSSEQTEGGDRSRIELQITHLDVESEDDENDAEETAEGEAPKKRLSYNMG